MAEHCSHCGSVKYYTNATVEQLPKLRDCIGKYIDGIGLVSQVDWNYIPGGLDSFIVVDPNVTVGWNIIINGKTQRSSLYEKIESLPFKLYRVDECDDGKEYG